MQKQSKSSISQRRPRVVISGVQRRVLDVREYVEYKELFFFLAWRDILVRYKQTIIGIAWAVVRPLISMAIFSFIFGRVAGFDSGGVPYPLLVFSALLPWQFFADSFQHGSNALIGNAQLVSKIYFPRAYIPASTMISSLLDFAFSFLLFGMIMLYYSFVPSWQIIFVPFFLIWAFVFTLGLNLLVSALNVKYRDIRHAVPFLIRIGIYVSPVGFSSAIIKTKWRLILSLNPLVGIIDGFRWAILGHELLVPSIVISAFVTVGFFIVGLRYFINVEDSFADVI